MNKLTLFHKRSAGFTLVELSLVLVVISLLIGSIVVGDATIKQARIRNALGDISQFTQAFNNFRDKYKALPGDFNRATALWGAANSTPSTCWTTVGTGTQTCDGDGDGLISLQCGSSCATVQYNYEMFRAWQHLANAGMITGSYSGVSGPLGPQDAVAGVNVPASPIAGGMYGISNMSLANVSAYSSYYFPVNYNHYIELGGHWTAGGGIPGAPILTAVEAVSIDTKLDDGLPGSGTVMTWLQGSGMAPNCATASIPAQPIPTYDITHTGLQCSLLFLMNF